VPIASILPNRGRVIDSGSNIGRRTLVTYIILIGLSMSLIPYTIDPYLPAFPAIGDFFGVGNGIIQASLTGVTIGIALGQLVTGPLSDAYGRRPLLLISIFGFGISAISLFIAPNLFVFMILRFSMGFFAASTDVVARAIVRDLFRGQKMLQMLSRALMIQALSPIIGPIIGSQVLGASSWHFIFLIFGFFGILLGIAAIFFLVETLPIAKRRSSTAAGLLRGYRSVLKDRVYVGLMLFGSLQLAALFGYLNIVPFLYQDVFGLSAAEFGGWFAFNSFGLWMGMQFGGLMARFFRAQWMLAFYAATGALAGVYLMATAGGNIWLAEIGFFVVVFTFGAPVSSIPSIALLNHGTEAGTAASLLGAASFIAASLMSGVYALLSTESTGSVGLLIFGFFGLALASLLILVRPWQIPDMREELEPELSH
jgi:MFS transporter, DHA1 family, multidrug resistance protein